MSTDFKTVARLLPALTRKERGQVLTIIQTLGAVEAPKESRSTNNVEFFYKNLADLLQSRTKQKIPQYSVFLRTSPIKGRLLRVHKEVDSLLEAYHKKDVTIHQTTRMTFYRIYAELVVEEMARHKTPLTLAAMIAYGERFPGILEKAFPGYLNCDLFEVVLQKIQGGFCQN